MFKVGDKVMVFGTNNNFLDTDIVRRVTKTTVALSEGNGIYNINGRLRSRPSFSDARIKPYDSEEEYKLRAEARKRERIIRVTLWMQGLTVSRFTEEEIDQLLKIREAYHARIL